MKKLKRIITDKQLRSDLCTCKNDKDLENSANFYFIKKEIKCSLEFNKILLKKQKGFQTKVYENKFNELIQKLNSYDLIISAYNQLINEEEIYAKGLKDGKKKEK